MSNDPPYTAPREPAPDTVVKGPPARPRLWPAVAIVVAFWCVIAFAKLLGPLVLSQVQQFLTIFWAPQVLAPAILVWWLFFSRQPWADRLLGLGLLISGGILAVFVSHPSMKFTLLMDGIPIAVTAVIVMVVLTRSATQQARWLAIAAASLLAWGYYCLLRFDGVTGQLSPERSWRWQPTAEDRFLAEKKKQAGERAAVEEKAMELVAAAGDWPEFRGVNRDSHVQNASLNTAWTTHPPKRLWQRRVGPGWSSFAVVGKLVFTQEQRGKKEAVVALDIETGDEVWAHEDEVRFNEPVSGAGPRATPTFHGGKIYALGGSGKLNCLDAASGKLIWTHDITQDAKAKPSDEKIKPPGWGFSSSPLVAQGVVVVFAGGKEGKGVLGYDAATGELRWTGGQGWHSYSSPQLVKFGDEEQVLMVSERGLEAFEPASGKPVWEHDWNLKDMFRVVQPHVVDDSQVIVGSPMTEGIRLLSVVKEGDSWSAKEQWTTKDLKPYFNDFVRLGDYLYGFDNDILVCIDLNTGKKKWKKGRYGNGQALLIGDAGLMLVLAESGEAVMTEVSPQGINELGKFKAINGKTWNHPVIARGKLLVRNSEEMACYELTPAGGDGTE